MSLSTRLFGNYHFNIGSNPEVFWEISQENTQDGVRGRFITNFMKILKKFFLRTPLDKQQTQEQNLTRLCHLLIKNKQCKHQTISKIRSKLTITLLSCFHYWLRTSKWRLDMFWFSQTNLGRFLLTRVIAKMMDDTIWEIKSCLSQETKLMPQNNLLN